MQKIINKLANKNSYAAIFLLIIVLLTKTPTINLDYHWDETLFAAQTKHYSINGYLSIPSKILRLLIILKFPLEKQWSIGSQQIILR